MKASGLIDPIEYFAQVRNYKNIILFGCGGKGRQAIKILNCLSISKKLTLITLSFIEEKESLEISRPLYIVYR